MPAPIFLVTDDPKATAGLGDGDHLLDVRHPSLSFSILHTSDIRLEGQLPPRHVRWYGTDHDQWTGYFGRNPCPVLQRVICSQMLCPAFYIKIGLYMDTRLRVSTTTVHLQRKRCMISLLFRRLALCGPAHLPLFSPFLYLPPLCFYCIMCSRFRWTTIY
jgi:hypothetical protein